MDIDVIAMVTMLVMMIILGIGILMILIIIGADQCKSDQERFDEEMEQQKIVSSPEYKERRGFLWRFLNK